MQQAVGLLHGLAAAESNSSTFGGGIEVAANGPISLNDFYGMLAAQSAAAVGYSGPMSQPSEPTGPPCGRKCLGIALFAAVGLLPGVDEALALSELAAEGAADFSAIGSTGRVGEAALQELGANPKFTSTRIWAVAMWINWLMAGPMNQR